MSDYKNLTKEQATSKIAELLKQAQELVNEAETVADQTGVLFNINFGGYGMGGSYFPNPDGQEWANSDYDYWYPSDTDNGWYASSQSC